MKIKVGIVGLGKMGLMHASIINMLEHAELLGICEKSGLIRKFGKKVLGDIKVFTNLEDFQQLNLDAVVITTPPASHFAIIKQIFNERLAKHILTEKPLATSFSQADTLCNLANEAGGVNMVGYQCRFTVTYLKGKQMLDSGDIGEPTHFKAFAYSADFLGAKSAGKAVGRGGVLEDLGSHIIDLVHWFFGEIQVVNAKMTSIIGNESVDEVHLTAQTSRNVSGEILASWCRDGYRLPEIALVITGSKGVLTVNGDKVELKSSSGDTSVWYRHNLNDSVPFFIGGAEYCRQDERFIEAINLGTQVDPDFKTASAVQKVIDQADQIAKGIT